MRRKIRIALCCAIIVVLCAAYVLLAKNGYGIPCPIKALTGLECAGCGNTRAALALLRLDVMRMLEYNLLFPLEIAYIIGVGSVCAKNYLKTGTFSYRSKPSLVDIIFLILLVAWTVARNLI